MPRLIQDSCQPYIVITLGRNLFGWTSCFAVTHQTLALAWHHHLFHPVSVQCLKSSVILQASLVIVIGAESVFMSLGVRPNKLEVQFCSFELPKSLLVIQDNVDIVD